MRFQSYYSFVMIRIFVTNGDLFLHENAAIFGKSKIHPTNSHYCSMLTSSTIWVFIKQLMMQHTWHETEKKSLKFDCISGNFVQCLECNHIVEKLVYMDWLIWNKLWELIIIFIVVGEIRIDKWTVVFSKYVNAKTQQVFSVLFM